MSDNGQGLGWLFCKESNGNVLNYLYDNLESLQTLISLSLTVAVQEENEDCPVDC